MKMIMKYTFMSSLLGLALGSIFCVSCEGPLRETLNAKDTKLMTIIFGEPEAKECKLTRVHLMKANWDTISSYAVYKLETTHKTISNLEKSKLIMKKDGQDLDRRDVTGSIMCLGEGLYYDLARKNKDGLLDEYACNGSLLFVDKSMNPLAAYLYVYDHALLSKL